MRAHYGYADGSGEYYITIDTDKCDGCGRCASACPASILEVIKDDYDDLKAAVKEEYAKSLSFSCFGYDKKCSQEETNCHSVCEGDAISHSW